MDRHREVFRFLFIDVYDLDYKIVLVFDVISAATVRLLQPFAAWP